MAEKDKTPAADKAPQKFQTEQSNIDSRTLSVERKGNIETTKRPNGTVIVNCVADEAAA